MEFRNSRSNSRCSKIRSLARPLSPPCGSYTSNRKRHSLYPKTDQVSRLLSSKNSLQVSKYQTLTRELNEKSLSPSRIVDRSVESKFKNQFQQFLQQPPTDTRNIERKPKPRFVSKNSSVNYVNLREPRSRQSDVASILSEIHKHIQSLPV